MRVVKWTKLIDDSPQSTVYYTALQYHFYQDWDVPCTIYQHDYSNDKHLLIMMNGTEMLMQVLHEKY